MASPRTMWKGTISFGLLSIPITVGKATGEQREHSLVTVCEHGAKIDRSERCGAGHEDCTLTKSKAVCTDEGSDDVPATYHVFSTAEIDAIEESTKDDSLEILDVQPVKALPMEFSMGTYYLRPEKGAEKSFALLHAALATTRLGMVTKWCRSATQSLCVIHASEGMILLTKIPFMAEIRKPGDNERKHWKIDVPEKQIALAIDLLNENRSKDFAWDGFIDEGYRLRSEAVETVLSGEGLPESDDEKDDAEPTQDSDAIMAALMGSLGQKGEGE